MAAQQRTDIPMDPREWRPQRAYKGRFRPAVVDPILEPRWDGVRVIAHFAQGGDVDEWGTVEVLDDRGQDAIPAAARAFEVLRRSVAAQDAVIDGVITTQATAGGEGVATVFVPASPLRRLLTRVHPDVDVAARKGAGPAAGEPAFVALDLLSIDGQPLLEVPLLERKRLLDGALRESELVRVTPWARPPTRGWFTTWRAAGFRGMVLKGANSRYVPGKESYEWTIVDRMP